MHHKHDGSGSAPSAPPPDNGRFELEHMLMEADRMMMQIVNLALSLIGFGFSINAFFNDVATRGGVENGGQKGRFIGVALLAIGLLFLTMGIWSQARYRHHLIRRYGTASEISAPRVTLDGRATPTFITAFLLLIVGVGALASIVFRRLL